MRVLVTGATGFLGSNLVRRLLSDGHQVRILARSEIKARPLAKQGAEIAFGDIGDRDALQSAVRDVEGVYHLAGQLFIPGVPKAEYYRTHVQGTRALVECCRESSDVRRLVHCSTTGVLGVTGPNPAREDAPVSPRNAYERAKWQAETVVRMAIEEGFPAVIARPGLVYGPGDLHLLGFFRAIQRGFFRPIGRQSVWLHPIFIDDLTEALVRGANHPRAVGECFHLAGQFPVTVAALASAIADALGTVIPSGNVPFSLAWAAATVGDALPARLRSLAPLTRTRLDFLTHSRIYDVSKARALIGFEAGTALTEGMDRTVAWYRREGYLSTGRASVS